MKLNRCFTDLIESNLADFGCKTILGLSIQLTCWELIGKAWWINGYDGFPAERLWIHRHTQWEPWLDLWRSSNDKTQSLKLSLVAPFAVFSFQMSSVISVTLSAALNCWSHSYACTPILLEQLPQLIFWFLTVNQTRPSVQGYTSRQPVLLIHFFFGEANQC